MHYSDHWAIILTRKTCHASVGRHVLVMYQFYVSKLCFRRESKRTTIRALIKPSINHILMIRKILTFYQPMVHTSYKAC
uniref:Uncharacterized protein n=1 Tax=Rhizophora mucronata TaxID=61149 RepID=A0A2P2N3R2_RHIMU